MSFKWSQNFCHSASTVITFCTLLMFWILRSSSWSSNSLENPKSKKDRRILTTQKQQQEGAVAEGKAGNLPQFKIPTQFAPLVPSATSFAKIGLPSSFPQLHHVVITLFVPSFRGHSLGKQPIPATYTTWPHPHSPWPLWGADPVDSFSKCSFPLVSMPDTFVSSSVSFRLPSSL